MSSRNKTRTRGTTAYTDTHYTSADATVLPSRARARRRKRRAAGRQALADARASLGRIGSWLAQTVTPGGWLLVVAATIGLAAGLLYGWLDLVGAAVASWVVLLVALLFILGTKSLEVAVDIAKDRVVVGEYLEGVLEVTNRGRGLSLPTEINLPIGKKIAQIGVGMLRGGSKMSRSLEIPTHRRGIIAVGPPGATRSSPVGVFSRETVWGQARKVFVYPQTTRLPSTEAGLLRDLEGEASKRIVNDDLSFHAIRQYVPGDMRRQIHWKSTAKTGQLMVRQYEETLRSEMLVLLDTRSESYASEDQFELGVSVAASFGLRGLLDGRELRFVAGSTKPSFDDAGYAEVFELATASRRAMMDDAARVTTSERGATLERVAETVGQGDQATSVAVVVTGSEATWNEIRSAALKFPTDVGVLTVVCDEQSKPKVRVVGGINTVTVALLDDLAGLMARRGGR